jgi:hypothetical protein
MALVVLSFLFLALGVSFLFVVLAWFCWIELFGFLRRGVHAVKK